MRKLSVALLIFIGTLVLVAAPSAKVPETLLRNDAPALEITTSILPVTPYPYELLGRRGTEKFRCTVLIHDQPGSQRVWGTKDIVIGPGESGEETAKLGQLRLHFRAEIARGLDRALTEVVVMRDGLVINRQKTTIWLERRPS